MDKPTNSSTEQKRRTQAQNNSLHLLFDLLAKELQKEGITMQMVLQKFILETPATKTTIKELLWKPLQFALIGKGSTTELLKQEEIDLVYDALNKFTSENWGISVPFPTHEINY